MSWWTHIVATLNVDTYMERKGIETCVREMLKNAPPITGSERNADVFVNVPSGYNHYCGADCQQCEYRDTVNETGDGGFTCDAPDGYECPDGKYQSQVVITVFGDLRDRTRDDTKAEWKLFKRFVGKEIGTIRNCTWRIVGW